MNAAQGHIGNLVGGRRLWQLHSRGWDLYYPATVLGRTRAMRSQ